jgi:hypothetical protein
MDGAGDEAENLPPSKPATQKTEENDIPDSLPCLFPDTFL